MSTIQLIGLAVAIVVLIVLIVTLVVTRRRGGAEAVEPPKSAGATPTPAAAPGSIFDEKPRDDLAGLGAIETPPALSSAAAPAGAAAAMAGAGVTAAAGAAAAAAERPAEGGEDAIAEAQQPAAPAAEAVKSTAGVAAPAGVEMHEPESAVEIPSAVEETPRAEEAVSPIEAAPIAAEETTPLAKVAPIAEELRVAEEPSVADEQPLPVEPVEGTAAAVALSEIIVTTNQQQVDLEDPEVRRLLKELIEDEIELAQQYKAQGQNVDAVLQLTEAEKACNALGLTSKARLIRAMIKELKD
jgi:hypothetical protein